MIITVMYQSVSMRMHMGKFYLFWRKAWTACVSETACIKYLEPELQI